MFYPCNRWLAGKAAKDVTIVGIITCLACVCAYVYVCVCTHTGVEWHRAKTSPHHIKYLQGQQWLQYQVLEKKLNIENQHFILNWTKFKATQANAPGKWSRSAVVIEKWCECSACIIHSLSKDSGPCSAYNSLRLGRLSSASTSMVVSLLWLRVLRRNKKKRAVIKCNNHTVHQTPCICHRSMAIIISGISERTRKRKINPINSVLAPFPNSQQSICTFR